MTDQPVAPATSSPEEKKSSKTWLIVLVVVIVLCCLCLVCGWLGYYLYQNGDRIFKTGMQLAPFALG
jgi:DNA-binding transcriptional regulator of glucitol operon